MSKLFHIAESYVQEENDNGKIQELIDQGLDVNEKDEYGISLVERACFGVENYSALFALWKAKATATSEYVESIFAEFEKGKTPNEFYLEKKEKSKKKKKGLKDLSKNFSTKKLKIKSAVAYFTEAIKNEQDAEFVFIINLAPFVFENHVVETELEFVAFSNEEMKEKVYSDGYAFEADEIEGSSIYIQKVHNPVELKKLKVTKGNKYDNIEAILFFDFEYEGTDYKNEMLEINFKMKK